MQIPIGDELFRLGLIVMAAGVFLLLAVIIVMGLVGHRLKKRLEQEYGKKRH